MNKYKQIEIKVGIVSLLAVVLLIVGISLGKGVNVSDSENQLKFHFDNSGGITEGSPVVVNGVRRGAVLSVENKDGSVLVTAKLDHLEDIKSDAYAKITILEITGGKKIELSPGVSNEKFDARFAIPGRNTADIADLVSVLGDVSGNAVSLVRNLDTLAVSINKMMQSGKLAEDVAVIADNTAELTSNMNVLLKDNYSSLQATIKNLNSLVAGLKGTFDKHEPNIDKLVNQLDKALTEANSLLTRLDETMKKADAAISDVQNITNEVRQGEGFANRLIYDKEFALSLDSTINALNLLVNKINNHGVNVNVRLGTRP